MSANIFIIGLNDLNRRRLGFIENDHDCIFHQLIDKRELHNTAELPVPRLLEQAIEQLRAFPGSIDGITGYMDFPISTMLPILQGMYNLPGASLESVLKCEHKYWSRLEQSRAVPEYIPPFQAFDPFDDRSLAGISLTYPYWIKPVKSCGSFLGFRIHNQHQFERAIEQIRQHINRFGEPFGYMLDQADLPDEVRRVRGNYCVAEKIISGRQFTVEGYVYHGEPHVFGVVDSVRDRNRSSFIRYEYPSRLPEAVQQRGADVARRLLTHIGFNNAGFNMEFFWDERHDRLRLIETNPRIAQAHCELYRLVDGRSSHQVAVDLALGIRPRLLHREGQFHSAAHFFIRHYHDGMVAHVPSAEDVQSVVEQFPEAHVDMCVCEGDRLRDLVDHQDSYSYELAFVDLGGRTHRDLLDRFRRCAALLPFSIVAPEMRSDDASRPREKLAIAG